MRIIVFGAAGQVGTRVVTEALARGHEVGAVVRSAERVADIPKGAAAYIGDARNPQHVTALSAGHDVVVTATRPKQGQENELVMTARALLAGLAETGRRLFAVGGAASLAVPGGGALVVDDPRFVPAPWRAIARACREQFDVYSAETGVDWTYLSPPALLQPGERTGTYRLGRDELLVDEDGTSAISVEDLAVAVLDEIEQPAHRRSRFTVAY